MDQTLISDPNQNDWHSCMGGNTDKRLLIFSANLTISLTLLIFSLIRLIQPLPSDEKAFYCGIVSLIVGIWIKSPLS
jgi:hypothetical protein